MINPMVNFIQRYIKHRGGSVVLSLFVVGISLAFFLMTVYPAVTSEIKHVGIVFKELLSNSELAKRAAEKIPEDYLQKLKDIISPKEIQNLVNNQNIMSGIQNIAKKLLPGVWNVVKGSTSFVFWLVGLSVIGLYLFFLLLEYEEFSNNWIKIIPPQYRKIVLEFVDEFNRSMNGYFRAQALVAFVTGLFFVVGFWIIGLPMAVFLGLFIGALNMVPYLQIIGFIPACILAIVKAIETNSGMGSMIMMVVVVFLVVQVIQDSILVPKIVGDATGLSPVIVLLSLSIWGKILGLLGLIIAIPITCLISTYYTEFINKIEKNNRSHLF
jgi:predicted PurR-regulated permease PerM